MTLVSKIIDFYSGIFTANKILMVIPFILLLLYLRKSLRKNSRTLFAVSLILFSYLMIKLSRNEKLPAPVDSTSLEENDSRPDTEEVLNAQHNIENNTDPHLSIKSTDKNIQIQCFNRDNLLEDTETKMLITKQEYLTSYRIEAQNATHIILRLQLPPKIQKHDKFIIKAYDGRLRDIKTRQWYEKCKWAGFMFNYEGQYVASTIDTLYIRDDMLCFKIPLQDNVCSFKILQALNKLSIIQLYKKDFPMLYKMLIPGFPPFISFIAIPITQIFEYMMAISQNLFLSIFIIVLLLKLLFLRINYNAYVVSKRPLPAMQQQAFQFADNQQSYEKVAIEAMKKSMISNIGPILLRILSLVIISNIIHVSGFLKNYNSVFIKPWFTIGYLIKCFINQIAMFISSSPNCIDHSSSMFFKSLLCVTTYVFRILNLQCLSVLALGTTLFEQSMTPRIDHQQSLGQKIYVFIILFVVFSSLSPMTCLYLTINGFVEIIQLFIFNNIYLHRRTI